MPQTQLYALHGFLGRPDDWTNLLENQGWVHNLHCPDLFENTISSFSSWAHKFLHLAETNPAPKVLMGYSLGGRLALHALIERPKFWQAAIIISAHAGLNSQEEKRVRKQIDESWAARFETDTWEILMRDWNQGEVFKETYRFERHEKHYDRRQLAAALKYWSLSNQTYLIPSLAKIEVPVLWITGANDINYVKHANEVTLKHPLSKKITVEGAGHRLPWQKPDQFFDIIKTFVTKTKRSL